VIHIISVYTISAQSLFNIIHKNARITTSANTISLFLYNAKSAKIIATIITIIVQDTGEIHRPDRHIFTRYVLIFAIVATDIHHKYKLNGTCTKYLSQRFHNFFHISTFFDIIISMAKKINIINTDNPTNL